MMSQKDGNNFDLFVQTTELSNCKVIWTGQITNSQGEVRIAIHIMTLVSNALC
jgi:hypothetical protein